MNTDRKPVLQQLESQFKENLPDHSVDTVIDAAKDLNSPTAEDLKTYLDYYDSYSDEELGNLYHILEQMLDARSTIETDLAELGFNFQADSLFTGIAVMQEVVSAVQTIHQYLSWEDGRSKEEIARESFERLEKIVEEFFETQRLKALESKMLLDFDLVWNEFIKMLEQDLSKTDVAKKADELEFTVNNLLKKHGVTEAETERMAKQRLLQSYTYTIGDDYECEIGEQMTFIRRFLELAPEIAYYFEHLEAHKPDSDILENVEKNRLKYGAKAAHLIFLEALLAKAKIKKEKDSIEAAKESLQSVIESAQEAEDSEDPRSVLDHIRGLCYAHEMNEDFFTFEVPKSVYIEAGLYDEWKAGKNVDEQLKEYYDLAKQLTSNPKEEKNERDRLLSELSGGGATEEGKVVARSSAVHSEDGENHTGAGIYHSALDVSLDSFESFKEAIISVWESTDSEEARAYRKSIGVQSESMGVIIQSQIDDVVHLQINSTKPHFESHAEALINDETTVLMQKRLLPLDFINSYGVKSGMFSEHSHVDWRDTPIDIYASQMADIMKVSDTMERLLGKSIQLEILHGDHKTIVVQLRPLPTLGTVDVPEFPSETYLYKGRGVGIGTKKIKSADLAIGSSSHAATIGHAVMRPESVMKHPAIVMTRSFTSSAGHIEQQCLEQGVLLITNDPLHPMNFPYRQLPEEIVVVSNGFEGRIYDAALLD